MILGARNIDYHDDTKNNTDNTCFTFQLMRYDKTSKFVSLKKNETLAWLYYNAVLAFGQKCKLYIVNSETKNEIPLLNCNDTTLEKFILTNPKYFIPSKESGHYKLNYYEDYYETDSTTFQWI